VTAFGPVMRQARSQARAAQIKIRSDEMDKKVWAAQLISDLDCKKCPFIKNEADVGVGIMYDCDHVCNMSVEEVIKYVEEWRP